MLRVIHNSPLRRSIGTPPRHRSRRIQLAIRPIRLTPLLPNPLLLILIHKPILPRHSQNLRTIQIRHVLRSLHIADILQISLGEDKIDLLERATLRLGVEEIDDGDEARVDDGEEEVGAPADVGDHDGRDHDDQEVEEPVRDGRGGVGVGARAQRVDLRGVEPGERQPGRAETGDVGEEADDGAVGGGFRAGDQAGEDEDHGEALPDCAPEEELSAAGFLDDEPGGGGEDCVDDHVDAAHQEGELLVSRGDGGFEEYGEVVDDGVAATDLLEELGGAAKEHAAEMLCLAASEHVLDGEGFSRSGNGIENEGLLEDCIWV